MPPSLVPIAPGICVRNAILSAAEPFVKTSKRILPKGIIAIATHPSTIPFTILSITSLLATLYLKCVLNSALCSTVIKLKQLLHVPLELVLQASVQLCLFQLRLQTESILFQPRQVSEGL